MLNRKAILVVMMVLYLVGCATTKGDWENAQQFNTVSAYQAFINEHPQSEFIHKAQARIEELHWIKAESQNTVQAYERFIGDCPNSKYVFQAERRIEDFKLLTPKRSQCEKLRIQGVGAFIVNLSANDTKVFIIPWSSKINFSKDQRVRLKDALLEASPIEKDKQFVVKPGTYVLAIKSELSLPSIILSDLGGRAPNNILAPSSSTDKYQIVVGGGIIEGALFKRVKDIYAIYPGPLFATGEPTINRNAIAKYNYLQIQGNIDIMFHFSEGSSTFDLWLISDYTIKPGTVWALNFRVPGK